MIKRKKIIARHDGEIKDRNFNLRLTTEELDIMTEAALYVGVTKSNYVMKAILKMAARDLAKKKDELK